MKGLFLNIPIFGAKKLQDSRKAEGHFKERTIKFQFLNLGEKEMSKGELKKTSDNGGRIGGVAGKRCLERNLKYLVHDLEEELLTDRSPSSGTKLRPPLVTSRRFGRSGSRRAIIRSINWT